MTALSQAAQGTNYQSAVANTSVPPPLPKDTKPPPPPEEPPKELLGPAQTKNIPAQPNFMSDRSKCETYNQRSTRNELKRAY